ncbi:MAG TPA: PP2C family protein-serine/threonine phosphatase [Gammaproteobacteria bacterium]|nr:PP2C family protein-serine/threonine phosphatase [Gammaproteobacteria bacterium]
MSTKVEKIIELNKKYTLEEQLAQLADVTQCFASSLNIRETLQNAIRQFLIYLDAEAASIFLLENDNTRLVCMDSAGPVDITGISLSADQGIVGNTVQTKACQMIRDVSKDSNFSKSVDEKSGFVTKSILCAPLLVQDHCIGALELINKKSEDGLFDERDQHLLLALASAAALAIHNARMASALVEQERLRKELELAREIQERLLPLAREDDFPVAGMNYPAREVSGDFYDFFRREDGKIYFNLADVSGKGMNAALLMAKASSLLHHLAKSIDDAGEILARVNDELCETVSHGMFITIVNGFVDPSRGEITLANAGHQPPLYHYPDGRFEEIPALAPPIGILPEIEFPQTTLAMNGGSLYLFTDGVTEAQDNDLQQLETEGLIRLIEANLQHRVRDRLENIIAGIRRPGIEQRDDITLMVIDCGMV